MGQQVNGSSKVKSPSESDWTYNLIIPLRAKFTSYVFIIVYLQARLPLGQGVIIPYYLNLIFLNK